jgi:hypothetical protein
MLQTTFNVDEGPVTLTAPATLSETSSAALADLFELFLRRVQEGRECEEGVTPLPAGHHRCAAAGFNVECEETGAP